jgi:hypothetical protein
MPILSQKSHITNMDDWVDGETQVFQWVVYQANDRDLEDITGWTMEFRLALAEGGTSVLALAMTIPQPDQGLTQLVVTAANTLSLEPFVYWYEVWRIDTGFETRVAFGDAHLKPGIPRI